MLAVALVLTSKDTSFIVSDSIEEIRMFGIGDEDVNLRILIEIRVNVLDESTQLQIIFEEHTMFIQGEIPLRGTFLDEGRRLIVENRMCWKQESFESSTSIAIATLNHPVDVAILGKDVLACKQTEQWLFHAMKRHSHAQWKVSRGISTGNKAPFTTMVMAEIMQRVTVEPGIMKVLLE